MAICIFYILIGFFLFCAKLINGADQEKWTQDKLENFPSDLEKLERDEVLTSLNASMELTSSDSKSTSQSLGKRKGKSTNEVKYFCYKPLAIDLTENHEILLAEKEGVLKSKGDFITSPLPDYQNNWNHFCCKLWPALPGYDRVHETLARCEAKFHPLRTDGLRNKRVNHYKGYLHDFVPGAEGWTFKADFLSCECKYMTHPTSKKAIAHTSKYFFAVKLSKKEYFLLGHIDPANKKAPGFKIIGFQSL